MTRPTIDDVARAANLSISTVKRVLAGSDAVREATMAQVLHAAEEIGFYGVGAIRQRVRAQHPSFTFVVLLQQGGRSFYRSLGHALDQAARAVSHAQIILKIDYMEDLAPDLVAERIEVLGRDADALALVSAEHPRVTSAIVNLAAKGVRTCVLISPLTASCGLSFVGVDSWKVGRSSAWFLAHTSRGPGRIGILVGNHRYRSQELNEAGFRSYFREHAPEFTLLDPISTFESSTISRELTERLLSGEPELAGLFIAGGGVSGAVAALRESGRAQEIAAVAYEMTELTQAALLDGTLTAVISHPLDRLAAQAVELMMAGREAPTAEGYQSVLLPFDIHIGENL